MHIETLTLNLVIISCHILHRKKSIKDQKTSLPVYLGLQERNPIVPDDPSKIKRWIRSEGFTHCLKSFLCKKGFLNFRAPSIIKDQYILTSWIQKRYVKSRALNLIPMIPSNLPLISFVNQPWQQERIQRNVQNSKHGTMLL